MSTHVIREIKIGSKLYDTVVRKVEEGKPITFTNGMDVAALGSFNILDAKLGRPGYMNIKLERLEFDVGVTR